MCNHGLVTPGGSNFPAPSGNSIVDAAIAYISRLFYAGKYIDAQLELTKLAVKAKLEEHKAILQALVAIAENTTDDNLKHQMFQSICMLAFSWA